MKVSPEELIDHQDSYSDPRYNIKMNDISLKKVRFTLMDLARYRDILAHQGCFVTYHIDKRSHGETRKYHEVQGVVQVGLSYPSFLTVWWGFDLQPGTVFENLAAHNEIRASRPITQFTCNT